MLDVKRETELVIIGGGPAGLAAACGAWDAGVRDLVILERDERLGGILPQCIHNGFGLHRHQAELTGPEYAALEEKAVTERGIPVIRNCMVLELSPERRLTHVSPQTGLCRIQAGAVILAMGCRERTRGALGIAGERPAGVLTTGTAQRLANLEGALAGRRIVILGSGDIGLIMARRMTCEGAHVIACVELMPFSSGLTRNIVQCLEDFGIPLLLSHTITEIHGRERVEGVTIARVDPDTHVPIAATARRISCDTVLLSVGLIPENELSRQAGVDLAAATGGPVVDQHLATTVPGIFACGNVLHVHDLVDEVSDEATRAGGAAAVWLRAQRGLLREQDRAGVPLRSSLLIRDGAHVRGVVPQRLSLPLCGPIRMTLRPDAVLREATIRVLADDCQIHQLRRMIVTPGEMIAFDLPAEKIPTDTKVLTVTVEGAARSKTLAGEAERLVKQPCSTATRQLTCIGCPMGCRIAVSQDEHGAWVVEGNVCSRGKNYAIAETTAPSRILTCLIRTPGSRTPLSVRTSAGVPKERMVEILNVIRAASVTLPVHAGDVVLHDVCGTGVDVLATRDVLG